MQPKTSTNRLAIFAYGSLLYQPGFAFVGRERAVAHGFARSFSQASPDHRGTPERPGRVLTLVRDSAASTVGAAYFVDGPTEKLLAELDYRERAGYERVRIEVFTASERLDAISWIALPGNAHDVGSMPLAALAEHVRSSVGPSGRNDDYVLALEAALNELGAVDPLVSGLATLLRR
jgi:cation transport protein ChaC